MLGNGGGYIGGQGAQQAADIIFAAAVASPGVSQLAQTSDTQTSALTFTSQAPYPSAVTYKSPGDIVLNTPAPVAGGLAGIVLIESGGSTQAAIGSYAAVAGGSASYAAIWLGPGVTPTSTNYAFAFGSSTTLVNGPAGVNFSVNGSNALLLTNATMTLVTATVAWSSPVASPTITQTALASTSAGSGAAGQATSLTAQAGQAATGAANNGGNGGNLVLSSGAGGTSGSATAGKPGAVLIQAGGSTLATFGGAGWQGATTSIALTTGTVTLSTTQAGFPYLIFTGSLTGNVTVVLPPTTGGEWTVDATAVTLNGHTITLQANSNAWATTIGVTNLYSVQYGGAGKLYGTALTP